MGAVASEGVDQAREKNPIRVDQARENLTLRLDQAREKLAPQVDQAGENRWIKLVRNDTPSRRLSEVSDFLSLAR
jgi:hypothetical protein